MSTQNDAARIFQKIAKRGADMASGQGARLGTVKSVSPFKLVIDGINAEFTRAEVVVNPELIGKEITASFEGPIKGTGSVGAESGAVSINAKMTDLKYKIKTLQDGDRVLVTPVGNARWAVICKVVTP